MDRGIPGAPSGRPAQSCEGDSADREHCEATRDGAARDCALTHINDGGHYGRYGYLQDVKQEVRGAMA
jgi:hypothetical protein